MVPKTTRSQDEASLPSGIVLFQKDADPVHRRRRTIFLVLFPLIGSLVLWPIFPRFSGILPLVLGLPLSFAWVVLALLAMFLLLLWLFLSEESTVDPTNEPGDG